MDQILQKKLNKTLNKEQWNFIFEVKEEGIYLVEIIASAKSWRQNLVKLKSFFKDDDLTLKIDGISFPKKSGKRGLFDSEAAFNGNNLKGLNKTDLFLIKLNKGKHTLNFLAEQHPKIHSIKILRLEENETLINYFPQDNYPIKDGNGRQWLTIVLVNLELKNLKITASAKQGKRFLIFKRDDADLKLIINNKIQENKEQKSHKYWFWCGRTLKGKEKIFEKELDLGQGINYIELWADRSPEIKEIEIKISETMAYPSFISEDILIYSYKGINKNEDYNRFDKRILNAVNFWNKFFLSQKYPPQKALHPSLIKAMIYVESRMGYVKEGFPDVMQVWDEANNTPQTIRGEKGYSANEYISDTKIGHMSYSYPKEWSPPKVGNSEESIFWGVRWLCHKAQQLKTKEKELVYPYIRKWLDWENVLSKYNPHSWYKERVLKIYKQGIDQDGNILWSRDNSANKLRIGIFFCVSGLIMLLGGIYFFSAVQNKTALQRTVSNIQIIKKIKMGKDISLGVLRQISQGNIGLAILNKNSEIKKWLPQADFSATLADNFLWFKIEDFNKDNLKEIAIEMQYVGLSGIRPFYLYQQNGEDFKLLLSLKDCDSYTRLDDLDNDGRKEIIHSFSLDCSGLAGRNLTFWQEIYSWRNGKYQKVNNFFPEIYKNLLDKYSQLLNNYDEQSIFSYKDIIYCLQKKADLNFKGVFSEGRECFR